MYTSETEIENYLLTTIDASFSSQITTWIAAAQKWIDNYTSRTFEASTSTKKYDGNGKHHLYVDDFLSVDMIWMVENDATSDANTDTLETTDFYLYQNDDPNETPYNKILLNPDGDYQTFERGFQNIWVKGSWGYSSSVPADIKMVATKLVSAIIKTGKEDGMKDYTEGDMSVSFREFQRILNSDLSVKQILNYYKKPVSLNGSKVSRV